MEVQNDRQRLRSGLDGPVQAHPQASARTIDGAVDDARHLRGPAAHHQLKCLELGPRASEAEGLQVGVSAAHQQLEEPLRALVERSSVQHHRRPGQDVHPGDRHAQRQIGGLAAHLPGDLRELHADFLP
jgi:hypothetical protein